MNPLYEINGYFFFLANIETRGLRNIPTHDFLKLILRVYCVYYGCLKGFYGTPLEVCHII